MCNVSQEYIFWACVDQEEDLDQKENQKDETKRIGTVDSSDESPSYSNLDYVERLSVL